MSVVWKLVDMVMMELVVMMILEGFIVYLVDEVVFLCAWVGT